MKWPNRLLVLVLCASAAHAATRPGAPIELVATTQVSGSALYRDAPAPRAPTHDLKVTFAFFSDGGRARDEVLDAAAFAAGVLSQCGIRVSSLELAELRAPRRLQYFATPLARELAGAVPLPRPAVYFVEDTLQQPAFDAEAIGRANSKTRPELADTVWITRGARDLPLVLAHELAHVLMDSGEHVSLPGNLMQAETAPGNTRLEPAQCARMRATGEAHGLLVRIR